ncbi:MAG TPA: AAA family ATPase, partial [Burkholderiaceae bacterium]|nr:AAA family ATPase [Burkholderiaceae bacterium]
MRFHCARANFYCDARRPQPAALENQDRRRVHFLPAPSRQLKAGVDIEGYQSPGAANRTLPFPLFRLGYDDVTLLTQSTGSLVVSARTANEGEGEGERVLLKLAWPASGEAFAREHELMRSLAVPGLAAPSERIEQPSEGALMVLQPHRGVTFSRWPDAPTSLPWRDALHIAQTLASTLAGLHDAGVVHRDLRPANLLLDQQARRTLLVDLHVAAADGVHKPQWNDPAVAAYLAPEQTGRLQHPVDHRADLYALGVLTYHLLTGRLPFSAGDALEWIHCHLARVPRSPIELASMPRGVSDLAMRLLAKSPDDRYQSAAALLYDLDRCLRGSDHDAESFVVGAHDARKRLQLSRKLYGRDRESATLQAAFHRVRGSARSELVLISGEAGSGKSSLAQMLRPVVTAEQGLFAAGKFDPHRREVPYAAFVQAFTDLLKAVLGESEAGVQRWRERLLQALGHNAQLMIQLVPALEQVIGQQPAALSLPPPEAELRFHMVFHQFVAAFVRADRPLVLFIDDLQWAEPASLDLLRRLLDSPAIGALLLIGAHRELEDTHPVRTLASDEQLAGRVTSISVPSLNQDALRALVAESLKVDLLEAAPLAATIGRHTGGNPLFATQLLLEMAEEGLLRFDNATRHWTWDSDAIAAKGCTQNVIELLLTKLQRLPPRALRALKHAACFGSTFASSLLERGLSLSHEQAEAAMAPAVDAGLAVRVGDGYRFVHDRVQETAYSLIEPHERARMRLHMGRLLVKSLDPHELEERLFDVVGALNDGAALIHDQADLIFLRQLNSKAGAKAKAAVDALAAHRYFTHARELLPPDAWSSCYDECFSLHAELAESAFLTGALEEVHALLDVMLEHAASIIDRARAYRIRMGVLVGSGQPIQGASVALEALRSMGLALPEDGAGVEAALRSLDVRLHERIAGRPLDALLELPRCDDPEVVAVMALLNDAVFPLFIAHPHLWPALGTRSVELSLIHGHTCESSFGYELLGDLHASRTQTLSRAAEFASLALRLDEQWSGSRLRHRLLMHHAAFVRHWFEPFSACRVLMERAVGEALEHGDIWMAANCMWFDLILALEQGESLQRVVTLGRRPEAFVQRPQLAILRWTVRLVMQAARCLQGLTSALNSLEDDQFSEAELVEALKRRGTRSGPLVWRVVRQMVKFLAGEPQQALIEAQQAASLIDVNETRPFLSSHHLFHLLARAALFEEADAGEQAVTRREFLEKLPLFEVWARACPANQQSRYAVLRAEWARLEGRNLEAATAYEEALLAARKHGNHQIELIASELAASFHAAGGLPTAAEGYLRRAEAACRRWGAQGLLPALQARHPGIALEPA